MSKTKKSATVRVVKTDKLDQIKLNRIARRYGITPISVRELQLGFPEDIPRIAAELLVSDGYVKRVQGKLRPMQERVDSLTTKPEEAVITSEDNDIVTADAETGADSIPQEKAEQA